MIWVDMLINYLWDNMELYQNGVLSELSSFHAWKIAGDICYVPIYQSWGGGY